MELKYDRDELEQLVKNHCVTLISGTHIGELAYRVGKGDYAIFSDVNRKEFMAAYTDLDAALTAYEKYATKWYRDRKHAEHLKNNPNIISSVTPPAEKR